MQPVTKHNIYLAALEQLLPPEYDERPDNLYEYRYDPEFRYDLLSIVLNFADQRSPENVYEFEDQILTAFNIADGRTEENGIYELEAVRWATRMHHKLPD